MGYFLSLKTPCNPFQMIEGKPVDIHLHRHAVEPQDNELNGPNRLLFKVLSSILFISNSNLNIVIFRLLESAFQIQTSYGRRVYRLNTSGVESIDFIQPQAGALQS